jgi:hypothetical protein
VQVHPAPAAPVAVSPPGNASTTVTWPVVGPADVADRQRIGRADLALREDRGVCVRDEQIRQLHDGGDVAGRVVGAVRLAAAPTVAVLVTIAAASSATSIVSAIGG